VSGKTANAEQSKFGYYDVNGPWPNSLLLVPLRRVVTLLLPMHPFAPFRTNALFGSIDPAEIDARGLEKTQSSTALRETAGRFGMAPGVYGDLTEQHSVHLALASLVLGSRWPLVASLKSVAAVFGFRSGDQRLISRDAGR
jgi:hypothetical protein